MPYVVVIERPLRGLDSPPSIQILGVDVDLKSKTDIVHALNQVERKGYILAAVQPLADSGTKYVFATKGSFFGEGSASTVDYTLTPYEQSLGHDSVSPSSHSSHTASHAPAAAAPTPAPAPAAAPVAPKRMSSSGAAFSAAASAASRAAAEEDAPIRGVTDLTHPRGPVTMSHSASASKKGDQYQWKVDVAKMPTGDWTGRDMSVVVELGEALSHWEVPGGKQLKDMPNPQVLKSYWNKNKKDSCPFMFPEKPVSESCAQKIAKAITTVGGVASAVRTGAE